MLSKLSQSRLHNIAPKLMYSLGNNKSNQAVKKCMIQRLRVLLWFLLLYLQQILRYVLNIA